MIDLLSDLVAQRDTLQNAFRRVGASLGETCTQADALFVLLPPTLAAAEAFELILNAKWHYDFGAPLAGLNAKSTLIPSEAIPLVEDLYRGVNRLNAVTSTKDRNTVLARLDAPRTHRDNLAEVAPLVHLAPTARAAYEVSGMGAGRKLIDWHFTAPDAHRFSLR